MSKLESRANLLEEARCLLLLLGGAWSALRTRGRVGRGVLSARRRCDWRLRVLEILPQSHLRETREASRALASTRRATRTPRARAEYIPRRRRQAAHGVAMDWAGSSTNQKNAHCHVVYINAMSEENFEKLIIIWQLSAAIKSVPYFGSIVFCSAEERPRKDWCFDVESGAGGAIPPKIEFFCRAREFIPS